AELARRIWLSPATLTGILDTLEKAGYVRRERDESDRRVVWLALTEAGAERVKAISRDAGELFHGTLAGCDPATEKIVREFLIDVIVTYHERSEQMADADAPEAVEVVELVKRYPKRDVNAVDGLSFAIREGEVFGLLG